jgi:HPt (histidine-containing phosphotransfer) domain-containing protein
MNSGAEWVRIGLENGAAERGTASASHCFTMDTATVAPSNAASPFPCGPSGQPSDFIDALQLQEAAGGSAAAACELVQVYLQQAHEIMERLGPAIQTAAALDIEYLAHKLAGSSAACGLKGLLSTLRRLEQLGRNPEFAQPEAEELLRLLQRQLVKAEKLLHTYCQDLLANRDPSLEEGAWIMR